MDGGGSTPFTHSPEAVFRDFRGRRAGVIKALTTEVQKFHHQCDPEKENLCLFGFPDETWEVTLPPENVPPELPEPLLGINFVRDLSTEKDWLAFVAVHSDSWLLAVAFYLSAQFGFDKESRTRLFTMINDLPTIFEVVTGFAKKQVKEKPPNRSNKSNSRSKRSSAAEVRKSLPSLPPCKDDKDDIREGHEDCEEHDNTLCGACGENYSNDGFWIFCDICERWFHGKCVEITPARAEHIKLYKCPSCSNNKG